VRSSAPAGSTLELKSPENAHVGARTTADRIAQQKQGYDISDSECEAANVSRIAFAAPDRHGPMANCSFARVQQVEDVQPALYVANAVHRHAWPFCCVPGDGTPLPPRLHGWLALVTKAREIVRP